MKTSLLVLLIVVSSMTLSSCKKESSGDVANQAATASTEKIEQASEEAAKKEQAANEVAEKEQCATEVIASQMSGKESNPEIFVESYNKAIEEAMKQCHMSEAEMKDFIERKPEAETNEECGNLPMSTSAKEVSIDKFVDGKEGEYRLIKSQIHLRGDSTAKKIGLRATIDQEIVHNIKLNRPDFKLNFKCVYVSQTPTGYTTGVFNFPYTISRKNGLLKGDFKGEVSIFGKELEKENVLKASYGKKSSTLNLNDFMKESNESGDSQEKFFFFSLGNDVYELRTILLIKEKNVNIERTSSLFYKIYTPESRPSTPVVMPSQPIVPPPQLAKDIEENGSLILCTEYAKKSNDSSYFNSCMKKIENKSFQKGIVSTCVKYGHVYGYKRGNECFEMFQDVKFLPLTIESCKSYEQGEGFPYVIECLNKFKNVPFYEEVLNICKDYAKAYGYGQDVRCLKENSNMVIDSEVLGICKSAGENSPVEAVYCIAQFKNQGFSSEKIKYCKEYGGLDNPFKTIGCLEDYVD